LPQYRDAEESDVFILSGPEDLVPYLEEKNGEWIRKVRDSKDEPTKSTFIAREVRVFLRSLIGSRQNKK